MSISICGHLVQENSASQERTYQYKFAFAVARRFIYYFMTSRGMTFFEITSCMPKSTRVWANRLEDYFLSLCLEGLYLSVDAKQN